MNVRSEDKTPWVPGSMVIYPTSEAMKMPGTPIDGLREKGRSSALIANRAIGEMMADSDD